MDKSTSNSSQSQVTKTCTKCGVEKSATIEYFGARKAKADGLNIWCRPCEKAYQDEYRAANRKRIAEKERQRVAANAEAIAAYKRQWAEANADKLKQQRRDRYEANRDEILAEQAKYRAENPEKVKASKRAEYERNREKYLKRVVEYREANKEEISRKAKERWPSRRDRENKRRRQWDIDNPEQKRETARRWKLANPERVKALSKRYYEKNKDRLKQKVRRAWKSDPAKYRDYKRLWYWKHKDVELPRRKENRQKNLDQYRKSGAVKESARRARKAALPDTFRTEDWQRCLEYFDYRCAACGRPANLFLKLSIDHFVPFSSPDCPGNVPGNVIPLCHGDTGCNASKGGKDALAWATEKFGSGKAKKFIEKVEAYFSSLT